MVAIATTARLGDEADYCSKNVPQWREGGLRSGADFMKEMASIAAKHGKKVVLWDDTMGQPLLGQDGVVVQWWHAPHELAPLVKKVRTPIQQPCQLMKDDHSCQSVAAVVLCLGYCFANRPISGAFAAIPPILS